MTPIDDHISTWLGRLETELASDDPAVRHDAMADAREHLVAARAELDDDATDADVQRLLEEYGDPVEVAESYRDAERLLHGDRPERAGHADIDHDIVAATPAVAIATSVPGWFGIVRDVDAWAALVYLLLALPIGVAGFTWTVAGGATAGSLLILIIGVPLALAFLASIRGIALLEGRIVETLLGERMPRRTWIAADADTGLVDRVKFWLADRRTWTSIAYLLTMLPIGVAYFTVAVTGLALGASLVLSPILLASANVSGDASVPTSTWLLSLPAVPAGLLTLLALLHLARGIGGLHGRYTKAMLVGGDGAARRRNPVAIGPTLGRGAILAVAAVALVGAIAAAGFTIDDAETHDETRQLSASDVDVLVIDGAEADVEFVVDDALSANEVRVTARIKVRDDQGSDEDGGVTLRTDDGAATLRVRCSIGSWFFAWGCDNEVVVHVGPDSRMSLRGGTDTGDIDIAGSFEEVDLELDTGNLEGSVDAERVEVETDTGHVDLSLGDDVERLTVDVDTGDIEIDANGTWSVQTSTDTGDVDVTLPTDLGARRAMRLSTDTGNIEVDRFDDSEFEDDVDLDD